LKSAVTAHSDPGRRFGDVRRRRRTRRSKGRAARSVALEARELDEVAGQARRQALGDVARRIGVEGGREASAGGFVVAARRLVARVLRGVELEGEPVERAEVGEEAAQPSRELEPLVGGPGEVLGHAAQREQHLTLDGEAELAERRGSRCASRVCRLSRARVRGACANRRALFRRQRHALGGELDSDGLRRGERAQAVFGQEHVGVREQRRARPRPARGLG
jgi:hypothetical protein